MRALFILNCRALVSELFSELAWCFTDNLFEMTGKIILINKTALLTDNTNR